MWESRVPWSRVVPGVLPGASVIEIPAQPATRVILRRPFAADPGPIGALMAQARERGRVVVEDSFGTLARPAESARSPPPRMSASCRPPAPAPWPRPSG